MKVKSIKEMKEWFKQLEQGRALYVWGMNGEVITEKVIKATYRVFQSSQYNWSYYNAKLQEGAGRIGADCSGAFAPMAGSDNTAAGYYAGCIRTGEISTMQKDTPCMVFKRNSAGRIYHIGWYLADEGQTVAEMASSTLNFRRRSVNGAGWTDWGIPKFVSYPVTEPVTKSGWVQECGGWRYYYPDGSGKYVVNAWYQDGDKWYWFNGAGMMVSNTWYQYKGEWYYLGSDGAMCVGLQTVDGKYYLLDEDGGMVTKPVTLVPDQNGALQYPGLAR